MNSAAPRKCLVCGRSLVSYEQQLRSDDEASALVTSCPNHGQISLLISKYRNTAYKPNTHQLPFVSRLEHTQDNIAPTSIVPHPMNDSNSDEYTHAFTRLVYKMPDAAVTYQYMRAEGRCRVSGTARGCIWLKGHIMWEGILKQSNWVPIVNLHTDECWMYSQSSTRVGMGVKDPRISNGSLRNVTVDYPPKRGDNFYVAALRDEYTGTTSIHCVCSGSDQYHTAHRIIREYITTTIDVPYSLAGCNQQRGWYREISSSYNRSRGLTIYIPKEYNIDEAQFDVTRANGSYAYLYCDKYYVIIKPVGSKSFTHIPPNECTPTDMGPGVASGYYDKENHIYYAKSMIRIPYTSSGSLRTTTILSRELLFVAPISDNNSGEWRDAVPKVIPSITLVASPADRCNIFDINALKYLNIRLLIRCISLCLSHSGSDRVLIVGAPSRAFLDLIRSYRCCFLYESDWDTEASGDTFEFSSIKSRCLQDGIADSRVMIPTRVERAGTIDLNVNAIILGLDPIDYSGVSNTHGYLLQLSGSTDERMLPGINMLGIPVPYRSFDNGSLLNQLYDQINGQSDYEFDTHIYSPIELYPYVSHVYKGD